MLSLDGFQLGRRVRNGLIPGDCLPRIIDAFSDHWLGDTVLVVGVSPGETPLDAGMAMIRLAVFVGHHADKLSSFHLGFK